MPSMMEMLRLKNLFGQPPVIGNDMPSQGGYGGNIQAPAFEDMFGPKQDPWGNVSFGPQSNMATPAMNMPANMSPDTGDYDVGKRMSELYHPETTASDRFSKTIDEYPSREANKPSTLRRIGAGLIGARFGGKAGFDYADQPFEEKLTDWKNRVAPQQASAGLERQQNVNERTLAYQTVANELRQHAQDAKNKNDEINANIRQHRAEIYDFKAKNPNMKIVVTKGGNVQAINPQTGEAHDTGIPSGSLTELDKMNLTQEHAIERIGATGEENRETAGTKHGYTMSEIGARGEQARETKGTPSSATGKGELPTQTRVRQASAARQLANSRPDLAKFIKLGNGNDFSISPPAQGGFFSAAGPTKEQYDEINNTIYGSGQPAIQQPSRTGAPNTATNTPAQTGRIKVVDKDGKAFTVPAEQLEEAKKQGYKQVS